MKPERLQNNILGQAMDISSWMMRRGKWDRDAAYGLVTKAYINEGNIAECIPNWHKQMQDKKENGIDEERVQEIKKWQRDCNSQSSWDINELVTTLEQAQAEVTMIYADKKALLELWESGAEVNRALRKQLAAVTKRHKVCKDCDTLRQEVETIEKDADNCERRVDELTNDLAEAQAEVERLRDGWDESSP